MNELTLMNMTPDLLDRFERIAHLMATATVAVPEHYRGKPGNCLAVVLQAAQWGMQPFALAQKTFFVGGAIGYEAQVTIAAVNSSDLIDEPFTFEWFGDWSKVLGKFDVRKGDKGEYRVPAWKPSDEEGLGVRATAKRRSDAAPITLELLLTQARTRNSTLWADDPRQQLAYLAAKRWGRLYVPQIMLGVYSRDELESGLPDVNVKDMGPAEVIDRNAAQSRSESLKKSMQAQRKTKSAQAQAPNLADVMLAINSAETPADFTRAGEMAAQLDSEEDRAKARSAYQTAFNAAKAKAKQTAAQADAPKPDDGADAGTTAADVPPYEGDGDDEVNPDTLEADFDRCKDVDTLDASADLIKYVKDDQRRAALTQRYRDRRADMLASA